MTRFLKRIGLLLAVVAVLVASLAAAGGAAAATGDCLAFAVDLRNDTAVAQTAVVYFGDPYTGEPVSDVATLTLQPGETGTLRLVATVTLEFFFLGGGPGGLTILGFDSFGDAISFDNCTGGGFTDGRLNNGGDQLAAPVALYDTDNGLEVWAIDPSSGQGRLLFVASKDEIAAVGNAPAANTVIDAAEGVTLYRLTSGEFQLNAPGQNGSVYEFRFRR